MHFGKGSNRDISEMPFAAEDVHRYSGVAELPWLSEQLCELGNEACTGDHIIFSLHKAFSISETPECHKEHKNGFNVFTQWIDFFLLKPALS